MRPGLPPGAELGRTGSGTGGAVTVRVPATSANLGPGFDSFGLALARYDEVTAAATESGLLVEVVGVGAGEVPLTHEHLVVRAVAAVFELAGHPLPGLHLRCVNCIPHGGGLGSSAAAIVAGVLLGRELLAGAVPQPAERPTDQDLFALATRMEGHPDNVAPALFGGLTLSYLGADGCPVAARPAVHPDVKVVVFSAHRASSTEHSRRLLPATVPHADASANAAAAGLLVHALTADPSFLLPATEDRLHQQYRAAAMPESAALVAELRAAGIAAVISGAGPSVLALSTEPIRLQDWERTGFDLAHVDVCTTGATIQPA
ncbi:homoserine kinase [Nakamurella sp. GG22]